VANVVLEKKTCPPLEVQEDGEENPKRPRVMKRKAMLYDDERAQIPY
jgi:hypothetical protein